jgi:hypothetical protein
MPMLWAALWKFAQQWISETEWLRCQSDFAVADQPFPTQFRQKSHLLPGGLWEGPFAFLVRDAAVGKVGGHNDFTAMPECLADTYDDFEEVFHRPLRLAFRSGTRSCVVTFTTRDDYPGAVRAAASYAYRSLRHLGHDTSANACFDVGVNPIPHGAIDEIQWLDDRAVEQLQ